MGAILLMRRRWQIPAGSLTIMGTFLALLWPMLSEYREAELIPALVLAGVIGDLLLARFGEHPHPAVRRCSCRRRCGRSSSSASSSSRTGSAGSRRCGWACSATTAGLGYAMSLLVFPPYNTVEKDVA